MRFMTWNMQGASGGKIGQVMAHMSLHGIEVACLQETGGFPEEYLNDAETIGNLVLYTGTVSRNHRYYDVLQYDSTVSYGAGNNRCSLAILCEPAILEKNVVEHASEKLRPLIGIKISGDRWIYNIHAPSSSGAAGVSNRLLSDIPAAHALWACLGDYNCAPASLTRPAGTNVVNGQQITHQNGGILDYAVTCGMQLTLQSQLSFLSSDHYSQIFQL
jgi:hypothetical protein